ncbi:MAG TPA: hypothetical protein VEC35_09230 [Noviherbaspirillum sp.]|nr:hypothetical protein [Noviherbaspirillum sp.]
MSNTAAVKQSKDLSQPIEFDTQGRMKYHPDFHPKQGAPWTTKDEAYLIEHYDALGAEEVSLTLGRTINTVLRRVCDLRKTNKMPKPKVKIMHRRTLRPPKQAAASHAARAAQ